MHKPRAGPRVCGHRTFAKDDLLSGPIRSFAIATSKNKAYAGKESAGKVETYLTRLLGTFSCQIDLYPGTGSKSNSPGQAMGV
jgi:hypothetical protein